MKYKIESVNINATDNPIKLIKEGVGELTLSVGSVGWYALDNKNEENLELILVPGTSFVMLYGQWVLKGMYMLLVSITILKNVFYK